MDEDTARRYAQAHADAAVRGDGAALRADFAAAMLPQLGALARAMPRPVRSASILSVDVTGDVAIVHIRYQGDDEDVTVRSEWAGDERPTIVAASVG